MAVSYTHLDVYKRQVFIQILAHFPIRYLSPEIPPFLLLDVYKRQGYGIYDEGLAVLSRSPILGTSQFYITGIRDYENWKTRKILGINTRTEYGNEYRCV